VAQGLSFVTTGSCSRRVSAYVIGKVRCPREPKFRPFSLVRCLHDSFNLIPGIPQLPGHGISNSRVELTGLQALPLIDSYGSDDVRLTTRDDFRLDCAPDFRLATYDLEGP